MKRQTKHIVIPIHIWEHPDLTPIERIVLCDLDSYCNEAGETTMGAQAIATSCGLSVKDVKATLASLQEKGGISVRIGSDGEKLISPYLYRERYVSSPESEIKMGKTPTDTLSLPWDDIAEKWAEICFMLPKITRWSPQRKNKLRSALKQAGLGIEDLYKVFRIISCTPFLSGASNQFSAHFDWVVSKSANLQKIYEGFYSKSYQEKRDYESIMQGGEVNKKQDTVEDFYR